MWIKSLDSDVWVNITHITHFTIQYSYDPGNRKLHDVVAFLNASGAGFDPRQHEVVEGQDFITIKRGTYEECEQFIKEQLFLQSGYQWLGYLIAGGVGAILTLIFS